MRSLFMSHGQRTLFLLLLLFFLHDRGLQSDAAAMGLISLSQSDSVRFKATKPQGSRAAAACSA